MRERTITIIILLILLTVGIIYSIYESLVDLRRREADMHLRYQIMLLEKDAELLEAEGRLLEYMAEVEEER
jgi:hypothetical protein